MGKRHLVLAVQFSRCFARQSKDASLLVELGVVCKIGPAYEQSVCISETKNTATVEVESCPALQAFSSELLLVCRQKLDNGQAQPSTALQISSEAADTSESDLKPTLESDDARYLRKRKLHMDSMFESAANSWQKACELRTKALFVPFH